MFRADYVQLGILESKARSADRNMCLWCSQRLSASLRQIACHTQSLFFHVFTHCFSSSFFPLQNQTVPTSSSSPPVKIQSCLRRQRRRVSHFWTRSTAVPPQAAHTFISSSTSRCLPLLFPCHSPFLVSSPLSLLLPLLCCLSSHPCCTVSGCPLSVIVSVWNSFHLRCVQVSPSCSLTFHFTGSSIMLRSQTDMRWMKIEVH